MDTSALRSIPDSFDPAETAAIDACLDAVGQDERVTIPLAIESGSRAWDFASPDSDYDCRFLYLRSADAYLSLWPPRDVIETPLDGLLDVNGWDVGKALKLVLKGNAVVIEWLRSPIVYRGDADFRAVLDAFATRHAPLALVQRHYFHLGQQQWAKSVHADGSVAIKKLFYILRPATALRWMRLHSEQTPPMHFPTLLEQAETPTDVASIIADLIERKSVTRELGKIEMPRMIAAFVQTELDAAEETSPSEIDAAGGQQAAEAIFRDLIARFGPK